MNNRDLTTDNFSDGLRVDFDHIQEDIREYFLEVADALRYLTDAFNSREYFLEVADAFRYLTDASNSIDNFGVSIGYHDAREDFYFDENGRKKHDPFGAKKMWPKKPVRMIRPAPVPRVYR